MVFWREWRDCWFRQKKCRQEESGATETDGNNNASRPGTGKMRVRGQLMAFADFLNKSENGSDGPAAVFIDIIGRPLTPLSYAGVARRTAYRGAMLFEIEKVKQPALIAALPPHHDPTSPPKPSTKRNHDSPIISTTFSTASARFCRTNRPPSRPLWMAPALQEVNWRGGIGRVQSSVRPVDAVD